MNFCCGAQPVFNGFPQYMNMKEVEQKFPSNVLFEGPLLKEGRKRVFGKFQERYCVLYKMCIDNNYPNPTFKIFEKMLPCSTHNMYINEKQSIPISNLKGEVVLEGINTFTIRFRVENPFSKHHDWDDAKIANERIYRFQIPKSDPDTNRTLQKWKDAFKVAKEISDGKMKLNELPKEYDENNHRKMKEIMVKHKDIIHCYSNELLKKVYVDKKAQGKIKILFDVKSNKIGRLVKKKKVKEGEEIKEKNKNIIKKEEIKKEEQHVDKKEDEKSESDSDKSVDINLQKITIPLGSPKPKSETKSNEEIKKQQQPLVEEEEEEMKELMLEETK